MPHGRCAPTVQVIGFRGPGEQAPVLVDVGCCGHGSGWGVSSGGVCPERRFGIADSPNTIRAAIAGEPDQLDPHRTSSYFSFEILENIFDTLVEPNEQLQMVPALAQRWEVSPDATRWTFTLRPGVQFHNGDPLTANDVVYSYRRIIDQQLSSSWRLENVATVEAPDAQTVVLTTKSPSPNLLANIGGFKGMAIVNPRNVESGEITTRPIGTGPFAYESGSPGTSLVLKARPGHWSGGPHVDGVAFSFISQGTTAVSAVRSGEVDWTDSIPAQQIGILRNDDALTVGTVVANDYWYVTMNFAKAPFGDTRIRQAVAYAIDRPSIAQVVGYGTATPNQLAIPKTSPWFTEYDRYTAGLTRDAALDKRAHCSELPATAHCPWADGHHRIPRNRHRRPGRRVQSRRRRNRRDHRTTRLRGVARQAIPRQVRRAAPRVAGQHRPRRLLLRPTPHGWHVEFSEVLQPGGRPPPRRRAHRTRRHPAQVDLRRGRHPHRRRRQLPLPLQSVGTQAYTTALLDYTVRSDKAIRFRDARLDRSRGQ